jgi:hypothetical protein
MPIAGLNAGGITSELKPKTKFYCSWTWCFLSCFSFFFIIVIFFWNFILFLFLFSFYIINFNFTICSSLFLPPSLSLLLLCYNALFSLPTTLSASSHPLSPCHHLPFPSSPILLPYAPPSYKLTTCWLAYWPTTPFPAIPDTSTLHYNRNIPEHAQGQQNPAAPIPLPPLPHSTSGPPFSATFTNFPNFYI